jgi:hypothetical protein
MELFASQPVWLVDSPKEEFVIWGKEGGGKVYSLLVLFLQRIFVLVLFL